MMEQGRVNHDVTFEQQINEIVESIIKFPEKNDYVGVSDLFLLLSNAKAEATEVKDEYLYDQLNIISIQADSKTQIINSIKKWDEAGYDSLNDDQKNIYNKLVQILFGVLDI